MMASARLLLILLSCIAPWTTVIAQNATTTTTAPQPPGLGQYPTCYVCKNESLVVGTPTTNVTFPDGSVATCGALRLSGLNGLIQAMYCPFVQDSVIATCNCIPPTSAPVTAAPTLPPASTAASEPTAAPVAYPVCYVCGSPDMVVTEPNVTVSIPDKPPFTCEQIQMGGLTGRIPADQCGFVPLVLEPCKCAPKAGTASEPTAAPVTPTAAPVKPTAAPVKPTAAPVNPTAAPVAYPVCYVCGSKDIVVTEPNVTVTIPDKPPYTCEQIQTGGLNGAVPVDGCSLLPLVLGPCKCAPKAGAASEPTVAPVMPTAAPVKRTAAPVKPTAAPFKPTAAPVNPTAAPVANPVCYVCGSQNIVVTEPTATVTIQGFPTYTCEQIQAGGLAGNVPADACPILPSLLGACKCAPKGGAASEPTVAPVKPTAAPVKPTVAPVKPTAAPIKPTFAPVKPAVAPVKPKAPSVKTPVAPTSLVPSKKSKSKGQKIL